MKRLLICLALLLMLAVPVNAALSMKNYTDMTCGNTSPAWGIEKQFDGSTSTYYLADGACQAQVRVCFPSPSVITAAKVYQNWVAYSPRSYTFNINTTATGRQTKSVTAGSYNYLTFSPTFNTSPDYCMFVLMGDGISYNTSELEFYGYNATFSDLTVTADFNATPEHGIGPLYVIFADNSSGGYGELSYNWSVSPDTGVVGEESTDANPSMLFTENGNFSITHCVSDIAYHSDCETKNDYIWVYNSTTLTTTYVSAIDAVTGNPVHGAQINLLDVENDSWVNTTATTGTASITTLLGHTIDGYASASGYNDGEYLGMAAGSWYSILMLSPFSANVTPGNVTLVVNVLDSLGNAPISGAGVTVISNTSAQAGYTNDAGVVSFVVQNKTSYLVDAQAVGQGYNGATQMVYSGTGSGGSASVTVTIHLEKKTVTPTATATTGPGGTTPVTIDPRTPQEKQEDLANLLTDWGETLLNLAILVTVFGLFKMFMKW